MQCKKIDLPPMSRTTKRTAAETLAELFRRQSRGQTAEINGANYFYGITALSQEPCPDYRVSMYINDQQDWQDAWQHIGLKPPGKLPYGVHGQMMLYARTGSEISLDLHKIEKREMGLFDFYWSISAKPSDRQGAHRHFAVVLFPAQRDGIANNTSGPTERIRPPGQQEKDLSPAPK